MSQNYEIMVKVVAYDEEKLEAIRDAILDSCHFDGDGLDCDGNEIYIKEVVSLHNEDAEEFSDRLLADIWVANGKWCSVVIETQWIDPEGYQSFSGDKAKYAEMMNVEA